MSQQLTRLHVSRPVAMLMDVMSLGENIEKARVAAGHTNAAAFARLIGVSPGTLGDWEGGRYTNLRLDNLIRIAKGAGCQLDDLVKGVDTEYDEVAIAARAVSAQQNKSVLVTSLDTGDEVQGTHTPARGGPTDAGSSSTTSRVLEERYRSLVRGAIEAAERMHDLADDLHMRGARLNELATERVPESGAAPAQSPASHRRHTRTSTGGARAGRKGRRS